jgi:hypothetical protein
MLFGVAYLLRLLLVVGVAVVAIILIVRALRKS